MAMAAMAAWQPWLRSMRYCALGGGRAFLLAAPSFSSNAAQPPLARRRRPSLETFRAEHCEKQTPVIIEGAMADWPALQWTPQTLKEKAGLQEVPVELARWHSAERRWGDYRDLYRPRAGLQGGGRAGEEEVFIPGVQMLLGDFIDIFMTSPEEAEGRPAVRGYLAQHQLLHELAADVLDPEYTAVGREVYQRNIWMGPKGTATPLHRDPYHNLFAQLWGRKYVRLYPPSQSSRLHPFTDSLFLRNASQVDVESPDAGERWPGFSAASYWECELAEGEMLYIPPKWWHYIRAEESSLSVSFWWSQ